MKPTIFLLINSVDIERGGLTIASLKQASTFADLGYETHMVTFNFNPKYPAIVNELQRIGRLHKNVKFHNMYNDLSHIDTIKPKYSKPKTVNPEALLKDKTHDKRAGHNAYRIYNNGIYTEYISIDEKHQHIEFIDYFNENRHRTKRNQFDLQGDLAKTTFMDLHSNKARQIIYYNKNGQAYLSQWNNPKTNKPTRVIMFNKDGSIKNVFTKDHVIHKISWLNQLINGTTQNQAIVISDTRSTDNVLIRLKNKNVKKVWRLHSGFVGSPYLIDSDIASAVKDGIDNIEAFDAAIVLTNEQKTDMINRFGEMSNLHVIPHFHRRPNKFLPSIIQKKDKNCAVVVSRLSTLKRIDHIIKAFKLVNDKLPNVRLEIYGKGDQFEVLDDLIKKLKLTHVVKLHGYIKDPDTVYKKGLFSILASKQEGFALSILESMKNKTPVVSYNIRYGPKDMIINHETGILVENGSIDKLAQEMIYLFNNPNEAVALGVNAQRHISEEFSERLYQEKWVSLFNHLTK